MRVWTNGRGVPPPILSSTVHAWDFNESAITDAAADLVGGLSLTAQASPALVRPGDAAPGGPSVGPGARRCNGSTQGFCNAVTAGADATALVGSMTVIGSFRLNPSFTTYGVLFAYAKVDDGAESEAGNTVMYMAINADRTVQLHWEYGAGSDVVISTGVAVPISTWVHFAIRRTTAATSQAELFLWGGRAFNGTGYTNCSVGSGAHTQLWSACVRDNNANRLYADIECLHVYNVALTDAQLKTAFRNMRLFNQRTAVHTKLKTTDGTGNATDLSAITGSTHIDWLTSVSFDENVDTRVNAATVTAWREVDKLSLAPLVDSRLNRTTLSAIGPDTATYTEGTTDFLALGRRSWVYTARMPIGVPPGTNDWQLVFDGYTEEVDWASDNIKINLVDRGQKFMDAYLESEKDYSDDTTGVAVETLMQDIIDDASPGGITTDGWLPLDEDTDANFSLYVPVATGVNFHKFRTTRMPLLSKLNELCEQIGWKIQFMWDPGTETFRLTLAQPARTSSYGVGVLNSDDYTSFSQLSLSRVDVRNVIRVVYPSSETTDPTGGAPSLSGTGFTGAYTWEGAPVTVPSAESVKQRGIVELTHTASVAKYGRKFAEIAEDASSVIDTISEAQTLALACGRDLCEPLINASCEALPFPEFQSGDMVLFSANTQLHTADKTLAITGHRMAIDRDQSGSSLSCRGAPAGGYATVLEKVAAAGVAAPPMKQGDEATTGLRARDITSVVKSLVDSSPYLASARGLGLRNPVFAGHLSRKLPPDGWKMKAGTWATDAYVDTSVVASGAQSLKTLNATGDVATDLIPIPANSFIEFGGNVRTSGAGTTVPQINCWLYKADLTAIVGASTVYGTANSTTWTQIRGVRAGDANAAYYKITCNQTGTGTAYFDSIFATICDTTFRAYRGLAQNYGAVAWTRVQFNTDTNGASAPSNSWDIVSTFDTATNIGRWTCPESGWYEFETSVNVETGVAGAVGQLRFNRFDGSSLYYYGPVGTNYAAFTPAATDLYLYASTGRIWVNRGAYIDVELWCSASGAGVNVLAGAGLTWFMGTLVHALQI